MYIEADRTEVKRYNSWLPLITLLKWQIYGGAVLYACKIFEAVQERKSDLNICSEMTDKCKVPDSFPI